MNTKATAVLLVEDSPSDSALFREMLEGSTSFLYDVTCALTIKEAIALVRKEPLDVILLDLSLPDSTGVETVIRMSACTSTLPIIVLTGLDDESAGIETLKQGAQDYLVKNNVDGPLLERSIRYAIERKGTEEELRQALKMEAVGQLAAGVAHDFNNFLTVILSYSDVLLLDDADLHKRRTLIQQIKEAAERAAAVTRQLLAFGRKQVLLPTILDLNTAVRNLEKMLRRVTGEGIELVLELAPDLESVEIDPTQVDQILVNLAANARDAMAGNGVLTIETQNVALDIPGSVGESSAAPRPSVMLKISDNGCGIEPETLARVFEPFFTTKVDGKGSGLGLSTVYGIVKQSGGEIDVVSTPNCGSTFTIYLPARGKAESETADSPEGAVPRGNGQNILLVEDEAPVRDSIAESLDTLGYQVTTATNGSEALDTIEEHAANFDLVISDVVMPTLDGLGLLETVRSRFPSLKVLLVSGHISNPIFDGGPHPSSDFFLEKPFTIRELAQKIQTCLGRSEVSA